MTASQLSNATPQEQFQELTRGVVDLHTADELRSKLVRSYGSQTPLLVKVGFDPSRPDLHLGHTLLLNRMRRFQEFGHRVVFLIGDFTGMIGDPSGRNVTRPALTSDEVKANAETYKQQVFKILDPETTEIRFNSEWLRPLGAEGLLRLAARYPLARMLERDDFKTRFREGRSIAIHELIYPLLQGYDSVELRADVELGATDQLFNLLVGRQLMREYQREYQLEPQVIMTGPILEGLDAKVVEGKLVGEKMSKSLGNYVAFNEDPHEIFGKLMSINDDLMWRYYELLSTLPPAQIEALRNAVAQGKEHPKNVKAGLAREIVSRFHGPQAAAHAEEQFERRFSKREQPSVEEMPVLEVSLGGAQKVYLTKIIAEAKLTGSGTEARKLIVQGGVKVNQQKVADPRTEVGPGEYLIQVGKLRAARVRLR